MGEVFHALEILNRTMKLGLSGKDLLRAEMGFKSALAEHGNPDPTRPNDPVALAEGYEFKTIIHPRAEKLSIEQLATYARKTVARPEIKVDGKTMKVIDNALSAKTPGSAKTATKRKTSSRKP
jgi:hypothetical protein